MTLGQSYQQPAAVQGGWMSWQSVAGWARRAG